MNHEAPVALQGVPALLRPGEWATSRARWALAAGLLLVASLAAGAADPPVPVKPPVEEPLVRCPDCDSKGKATCPECGGRGEIWRPCPICQGAGQKPCPVCSKDDKGAGRVTCGYCGGKGVVGAAARTCPRCEGAQALPCETCGGRGTLACRKEVFDKICPVCRFAGKVVCPTCGGTLWVSPAVLDARRPAREDAAREEPEEALSPSGKDSQEKAVEVPAEAQLMEKYTRLARDCESHFNIFWLDLSANAAAWKTEAYRLERKLREAGADPRATPSNELSPFLQRTTHFLKRWTELRALYVAEREAYVKLQGNWKDRTAAVAAATPRRKSEVEEQWNGRIDLLLRILEKHSRPLSALEPQWLSKEIAELETLWKSLKPRSEAALTAAQVAVAAASESAESRRAQRSSTSKDGAAAGRSPRARKPAQVSGGDAPAGPPALEEEGGFEGATAAEDPSLAATYDLFRSSGARSDRQDGGGEAGAGRRRAAASGAQEMPLPGSALPWALAGATAVVSALLAGLYYKRKKARREDEEGIERARRMRDEGTGAADPRHFQRPDDLGEDAFSSTQAPGWPG